MNLSGHSKVSYTSSNSIISRSVLGHQVRYYSFFIPLGVGYVHSSLKVEVFAQGLTNLVFVVSGAGCFEFVVPQFE